MTDPNLVQTKLHNQFQASESEQEVEDSRYLYSLTFYEDIGWDWAETQVRKVSAKLSIDLEVWKLKPTEEGFAIIVREVDRRSGIDDSQGDLFDYQ